MITGTTTLVAHIGFPTHTFKSPQIYNPWFEHAGVDAVVVPMSVRAEHYPSFFAEIFKLDNVRGALVTMPHKVTTSSLVDELSPTAQIAGAVNAVLKRDDGSLLGEQFDGTGFVRGVRRKGRRLDGASALVVGSGGVGSAIAASLAAEGVARLSLHDATAQAAESLAERLRTHYRGLEVTTGVDDPAGHDVVVNATPLGMAEGDPLPIDVDRLDPGTFVGEVVLSKAVTPFLSQALARDCQVQAGTDMLFEQIPAYLEFFGFGTTTPAQLRELARLPD